MHIKVFRVNVQSGFAYVKYGVVVLKIHSFKSSLVYFVGYFIMKGGFQILFSTTAIEFKKLRHLGKVTILKNLIL